MKITQKYTQHQTQQQRIVMTPKLQQAIKVLMLPQIELSQYIEQQMEQNPMLEIEEEFDTALTLEDYDPSPDLNTPEKDIDRVDTEVDIDWHSVFDDLQNPTISGNDNSSDPDAPEPDVAETQSLLDYLNTQLQLAPFTDTERQIGELIIGNLDNDGQLLMKLFSLKIEFVEDFESGIISTELSTTLANKLSGTKAKNKKDKKEDGIQRFEIGTMRESPKNPKIETKTDCWELIDTKDKKKYTVKREHNGLSIYVLTFEEIASEVDCSVTDVETVLRRIQNSFDPVGIAYRDIKESLNIQIDYYEKQRFSSNGQSYYENDELFEISRRIIKEHFEDISKNRILSISKSLEVDKEKVGTALEWIRTLSPYPGRYFSDPTAKVVKSQGAEQGIIPDVQIIEIDGEYQVFPMDDYIPRLRINPFYVNMMRNNHKTIDQETKKWIEQKYNDAADLLSSIAQRGRTIERVTEAIFEIQSEFLNDGANTIKPLTLKTVAKMAGVHESTVSRVTSNKYVETPQGTYPLKFFFSNKLTTTHGNSVSANQVKAAIRELIREEDAVKPLSDQAISTSLNEQGIIVARRTVQKYREELDILPSRQRKNREP